MAFLAKLQLAGLKSMQSDYMTFKSLQAMQSEFDRDSLNHMVEELQAFVSRTEPEQAKSQIKRSVTSVTTSSRDADARK